MMHTVDDLKTFAAQLPEGWEPVDPCRHCSSILVNHRVSDLCCPIWLCRVNFATGLAAGQPHVHSAACWNKTHFELDPQVAARRRFVQTMAPGGVS